MGIEFIPIPDNCSTINISGILLTTVQQPLRAEIIFTTTSKPGDFSKRCGIFEKSCVISSQLNVETESI